MDIQMRKQTLNKSHATMGILYVVLLPVIAGVALGAGYAYDYLNEVGKATYAFPLGKMFAVWAAAVCVLTLLLLTRMTLSRKFRSCVPNLISILLLLLLLAAELIWFWPAVFVFPHLEFLATLTLSTLVTELYFLKHKIAARHAPNQ